ncbi:type IV toxin-antitoxin system AbiEi family antitoxin domain-containing protein [Mesorhizobium amorphae]
MSSPERAYLEVLMDVPGAISFEHADQLLQGMTVLSTKRMEQLLRIAPTSNRVGYSTGRPSAIPTPG